MRGLGLLGIVATAGLCTLAIPAAGQDGPPSCSGRGSAAPDWFERPPPPPRGIYQAEARSGGCPNAETAQKVAARTAAWRLAQLMSAPVIVEDLQRVRRRLAGHAAVREEDQVELVQRVLAGRILAGGWAIHRQATQWTQEGLVEHFLIARADSASIRELAVQELERYLSQPRAGTPGVVDLEQIPDADFSWANLPPRRAEPTPEKAANRSGRAPVRTLVLSGTASTLEAAVDKLRILEAAGGLNLLPSGGGAALVAGGGYTRDEGRSFALLRISGRIDLLRSETVSGFLLAAFQGWPGLYLGYRRTQVETRRPYIGGTIVHTEPSFVLGLGIPPFTERSRASVQNAFLEIDLSALPTSRAVRAGLKGNLTAAPGLALRGLLSGEVSLTSLGPSEALLGAPTRSDSSTEYKVLARRFRIETGLELAFFNTLGVFGIARIGGNRLIVGWGPDLANYAGVSEDTPEFGLVGGVRVAF